MPQHTPSYAPQAGDPAPSFFQRTPANPRYAFDSAAGRYLVLCFIGSAALAQSRAALSAVLARRDLFNDDHAAFFAVSHDPEDEAQARLMNQLPGFRVFWDFDLTIAKLYGAVGFEATPADAPLNAAQFWLVLDPTMRVIANIPFASDGSDLPAFFNLMDSLPPPARFANIDLQAPILFLPRVFEPELCQHLVGLYESSGGYESGFMRQIDGRTVGVSDPNHKRRKDYNIEDKTLISGLQARVLRRIVPEIKKVHHFAVTRMERYIVACYAAEDGGHFAPHRDNTTSGTAHRRFAVSINLNDDFDGGEVGFPEYGPRSYKPPVGGAVVFSCALLHKVSRVTRGRRFAFLPFLYDDDAARLRERNATLVGAQGSGYRAG
jgi:predicted 2-oxoglutarate/Fe(II)-dependent dioxygenase YbiX/peroxiredoxin